MFSWRLLDRCRGESEKKEDIRMTFSAAGAAGCSVVVNSAFYFAEGCAH
jgi:hypothetical protein